jgi:hypothetical protein
LSSLSGPIFFWSNSITLLLVLEKKKTLGEMVDQVRSQSILDLMVEVMEYFNLPVPGEGGLLYKLKAVDLKLGK